MIKITILRLAFIAFTLMFAACATELRSMRLGEPIAPKVIPGEAFTPIKSKANVGDVMLTEGEYPYEVSGLQFEAFRVEKRTKISVEHKLKTFEFSIPAGDYHLRSRVNGGTYYVAPSFFAGLNGTRIGYGGLFVPNGASEATEFYWNWNPDVWNVYQAKLTSPISGTTGKSIVYPTEQESSGPVATLTYAGVAAGQIHFVYKEFTKDGLARPAFTQEVSLDYKPGGTYAYKDAQFTVEKADSTHISFTLLRPL